MPWDKRLNSKEIVVRREHLNSNLRELIGGIPIPMVPLKPHGYTIRQQRVHRGFGDIGTILGSAFLLLRNPLDSSVVAGTSLSIISRTGISHSIQKLHESLAESMSQNGIFDTKFEGHYPDGWISAGAIKETHPIFFVDAKGDMHFLKNSRMEYARYKFQQTKMGKLGLNLWRWRCYLKPPKAPAKAAEKAQVGELVKQWSGTARNWLSQSQKLVPARNRRMGFPHPKKFRPVK